MRGKQILIITIIVIIAIIACFTTYMIVNSNDVSYATLRISNSCTIEVPNENNTVEHVKGNITKFSFNSSHLNISHEKSGKNNELKAINTKLVKDSKEVENNIFHEDSSGIYSTFIENKNTGDALLITSNNLDLLKKVANSVKFTKPANIKITNKTNDTAKDNTNTSILDIFQNNKNTASQHTSSNNQSSNNNPTPSPTPAPTPSDDSSDKDSKQDEDSKYPSFIPG